MNVDKLFTLLSSIVTVLFLGSVALFTLNPIEKSFAGIFPLIVGAGVVFSVMSVPLWIWSYRSLKRRHDRAPWTLKVLLLALALPPACVMAGFILTVFLLFRGR